MAMIALGGSSGSSIRPPKRRRWLSLCMTSEAWAPLACCSYSAETWRGASGCATLLSR